jgi:hypothetical protein
MAMDLHVGAHVKLADGSVQGGKLMARKMLLLLGGVQALMPLFPVIDLWETSRKKRHDSRYLRSTMTKWDFASTKGLSVVNDSQPVT